MPKPSFDVIAWRDAEIANRKSQIDRLAVAFGKLLETQRVKPDGKELEPCDVVIATRVAYDSSDSVAVHAFLREATYAGLISRYELGGNGRLGYSQEVTSLYLITAMELGQLACVNNQYLPPELTSVAGTERVEA